MKHLNNSLSDLPNDADLVSMKLKNGDVVICYASLSHWSYSLGGDQAFHRLMALATTYGHMS
jgi:hypothetical protein